MYYFHKILQMFLLSFFFWGVNAQADVVKPALIEINVNAKGQVDIEARASIEALLTGINSQYKNTQDAPNAEEYDALRKMTPDELAVEFEPFKTSFLEAIYLRDNHNQDIPLSISSVKIPERGYVKVPRISIIKLSAQLDVQTESLQWYYPLAFGDNAVRLRQVDKVNKKWHWSEWQWLRKDKASTPFSLSEIVMQRPLHKVVADYIAIGFDHIIPNGWDHILFILGLFLFSAKLKPLLQQVTLFTLAHTLTLGLSINGVISLPASIVEPLITVSIAYVGIENIVAKSLHRSRLFLVYGFGLLHGLSFATMLADFGMPDNAFATALISFNVGVELGQLTIIFAAFIGLSLWLRNKQWYRSRVTIPASLLISVIALYWTAERLLLI